MTKGEFIESMKNIPDDTEIYFWDFNHISWREGKALYLNPHGIEKTVDGESITSNFIGIL